ncbi:MAG: hypothetical protein GWP06_00310 [Actinobacteria bacterium]|nr:hypothetical protein [Actinomycetota bacterium]
MSIESAKNLASIQNTVLKPQAEDVASLINIIGSYEAGKTIVDEVPKLSLSAQSTGSVYGFGSMLHRLHIAVELGSDGQVSTYITPQAEAGGAAAAVGEVDFTGSVGILAGTLAMYYGADRIPVTVTDAMTVEALTDACVLAISANVNLNISGAKHAATFELDVTSKTLGTFGNAIGGAQISFNRNPDDVTPTGITIATTQPVGGTGLPTIADALNGMGTGDNKNELKFTAIVHGYGQDTTTLNSIRTYVGPGDELTGLYAKIVARPLYSATGDNLSTATAAIAIGAARTTDRANVIFPVAGSKNHPSEIGAQFIGIVERTAKSAAARSYGGQAFTAMDPGDEADRWTNDETTRDLAVNAGISTSIVDGGVVKINDAITMYHPNTIPETSNIYREVVNIRKIRNMLANEKSTFGSLTLSKNIIVEDVAEVSSVKDKQFAIDLKIVRSTHIALIKAFVKKAWLYESAFAIANLEVALRSNTDGFDSIIKAILSGVNKISDNQIQADISTAVLQ